MELIMWCLGVVIVVIGYELVKAGCCAISGLIEEHKQDELSKEVEAEIKEREKLKRISELEADKKKAAEERLVKIEKAVDKLTTKVLPEEKLLGWNEYSGMKWWKSHDHSISDGLEYGLARARAAMGCDGGNQNSDRATSSNASSSSTAQAKRKRKR